MKLISRHSILLVSLLSAAVAKADNAQDLERLKGENTKIFSDAAGRAATNYTNALQKAKLDYRQTLANQIILADKVEILQIRKVLKTETPPDQKADVLSYAIVGQPEALKILVEKKKALEPKEMGEFKAAITKVLRSAEIPATGTAAMEGKGYGFRISLKGSMILETILSDGGICYVMKYPGGAPEMSGPDWVPAWNGAALDGYVKKLFPVEKAKAN